MKIGKENQLGLLFRETPLLRQSIIKKQMSPDSMPFNFTQEYFLKRLKLVENITESDRFTDYYITNTVKDIASSIKITEDFDYRLLSTIPAQHSTYLLGESRFVRFYIADDNIYIIYVEFNRSTSWLNYEMFRIDTVAGVIHGASDRCIDLARELTQFLVFVNLSEVDTVFLPPNRKVGTRQNGYKNSSAYRVTVVDSSWNKFVVRTEGFGVSGHLRLQAHGKNFGLRKLIWIDSYDKQGYKRNPKKKI
jgi:hypothetical protein